MTPLDSAKNRTTRFIFSKSHFAASTGRVKFGAFEPTRSKLLSKLATSTYLTETVSEDEIWRIGKEFVEPQRGGSPLRARADLSVEKIVECELSVVLETSSHPLHANILEWPDDESVRQLKATQLADEATLILPPLKLP